MAAQMGFRAVILNDTDNQNYYNGTLPDGVYGRDTLVHFACRSDGATEDEVALPNQKPFYLFRFHDHCQKVMLSKSTCM